MNRRWFLLGGAAALATAACKRAASRVSTSSAGTVAPGAPDAGSRPPGSGAPKASTPGPSGDPRYSHLACALSRDGRRLAVGAGSADADYEAGGPLVIWDFVRGAPSRRRMVAPGGIGMEGRELLAFSPSGHLLVASCNTNEVHLFDAESEALATVGEIALSHEDSAPGACLLPGETALFTSGEKGLALVPIKGTHQDIDSPEVRWFPGDFPFFVAAARADGLVVGANPRRAQGFDTAAGRPRWTSTEASGDPDTWDAGLSPDASELVAATGESVVFLDTGRGVVRARDAMSPGRSGGVVWDAAGRRVAILTERFPARSAPDVAVYDGRTLSYRLGAAPRRRPWLMAPDLCSFAFSPDGGRGVLATEDGKVVLYRLGASPRRLAEMLVTPDPEEWLGVFWGAADTVVAITSREILLIDGARGAVRSRTPLGFPIRRDAGG